MEIGKEGPAIVVEPIESPFEEPVAPERERPATPEREREHEEVPA